MTSRFRRRKWRGTMAWMACVRHLWIVGLVGLCGCRSMPAFLENPTTVASNEYEQVWNGIIEVIERYFDVAYENRYDGRIETFPKTGPTLLEPWLLDAVGFRERLEGTFQTVRRQAWVLVQPTPTGGFTITVEVYKELEYLERPAFSTLGSGTFLPSIQPVHEPLVTSPIEATHGWISLGRDQLLEARILEELRFAVDG